MSIHSPGRSRTPARYAASSKPDAPVIEIQFWSTPVAAPPPPPFDPFTGDEATSSESRRSIAVRLIAPSTPAAPERPAAPPAATFCRLE